MLKDYPYPLVTRDTSDYEWEQLTLGISLEAEQGSIVADFWEAILKIISKFADVEINKPEEAAWFHLRRYHPKNEGKFKLEHFDVPRRIELLRVKKDFLNLTKKRQLICLVENQMRLRHPKMEYPDVLCAGWWPSNLNIGVPPEFRAFLQKLSILRIRMCEEQYYEQKAPEDDCPKDSASWHEANNLMRKDSFWSEKLSLWFPFASKKSNLELPDFDAEFEYTHWFHHILSNPLRK